jgi:hypothetical protein
MLLNRLCNCIGDTTFDDAQLTLITCIMRDNQHIFYRSMVVVVHIYMFILIDDQRAIDAIVCIIKRYLYTRTRLNSCIDCLITLCNRINCQSISQLIDPLVGCILSNEQHNESITVIENNNHIYCIFRLN